MSQSHDILNYCPENIKGEWIYKVFGDCPVNTMQRIGFCMGLVSLALYISLIIPQLIENYKSQKGDGISIYLLIFWLFGDICNLVGSILTQATPIMKIIAGYYIIHDLILLTSLSYYEYRAYTVLHNNGYYGCGGYWYGGHEGGYYGRRRNDSFWGDWFCLLFLIYLFTGVQGVDGAPIMGEGLSQTTASYFPQLGFWEQVFYDTKHIIGFVLGVVAGLCYIASRIPQIRLNGTRKSCKGVSIWMFYLLFFSIVAYCISVFFQSTGWAYLMKKSPWLVSYILCAVLDAFIIGQCYLYGTGEGVEGAQQNVDV